MKAMIFSAGMGTRLKPLTDNIPKALVPIAGVPMIERTIRTLIHAGCTEVVVNVHHFAEQIIEFIEANHSFGIKIHISDERGYLLDTGGGLKHAAEFLKGEEPILLYNVDILSNVDLKKLYQQHLENNALATLLVSNRKTSRYLLFEHGLLHGWQNIETGEVKSLYPNFDSKRYESLAFAGIHVVSPAIFDYMEEWTGKFSIIQFYLFVCAKAPVCAYKMENLHLLDIGKIDVIEKAEAFLKDCF